MKRIIHYWELRDFCASHGRVVPHNNYQSKEFRSFHCEDRTHDASETIVFSEKMPTGEATMIGILCMSGYVVEFAHEDKLLFCTKEEFEKLSEESAIAEKEEREREEARKAAQPENPARPRGMKITRADMKIEYKSYEACTDYPIKLLQAKSYGYLTPPYPYGDFSFMQMICKDDCIFCHCPFYDTKLMEELRHNHRDDYDTWVLDYFRKQGFPVK